MAAQTIAASAHYKNFIMKQQTVTTSATALTGLVQGTDAFLKPENIFVQAPSTNTGTITIGKTGVTSGGAGIELAAGANINLPTHQASDWFVICSTGTQKLNIVYMQGVN